MHSMTVVLGEVGGGVVGSGSAGDVNASASVVVSGGSVVFSGGARVGSGGSVQGRPQGTKRPPHGLMHSMTVVLGEVGGGVVGLGSAGDVNASVSAVVSGGSAVFFVAVAALALVVLSFASFGGGVAVEFAHALGRLLHFPSQRFTAALPHLRIVLRAVRVRGGGGERDNERVEQRERRDGERETEKSRVESCWMCPFLCSGPFLSLFVSLFVSLFFVQAELSPEN